MLTYLIMFNFFNMLNMIKKRKNLEEFILDITDIKVKE